MPPKKHEKEEETVSLEQVKELLQQQREHFLDLLNQQEKTFRSFVELIINTSNQRWDDEIKRVQEFKTSLEFSQGDIDCLKKELAELKSEMKTQLKSEGDLGERIRNVNESLVAETTRADYLEAQSRRSNLIFEGIREESADESWAESEKKVKDLLEQKLGLSRDIELERVHRIARKEDAAGPIRGSPKPRAIIAKFIRFKDRSEVMANAKKLKGTNIYINEDFIDSVRKRRKELLPAMFEARKQGKIAFLRYDKLVTYDKKDD